MTNTLITTTAQKEMAEKIFRDRVRILHSHLLTTSIPATLLCATVVIFGLYRFENKPLVISWYLAILLICAIRFALLKWYEHDQSRLAFHLKLFTITTILSGIIWGVAGAVLTQPHNILPRVVIIIVIAGLNAGGCQTLTASKNANSLFMLTSIVPLGLWLLLQKQEIYTYLSLAIFGYLGFMLVLAYQSYYQLIQSLQLHYENELLLKKVEKTNEELHAEIIEHEKAKNQLNYLARHDSLTGLDNRFSFDAQFEKVLTSARDRDQENEFCVLFVDVDRFKLINDNYGHDIGDLVLIEVAQQLKKQLCEQDYLARVGGDEFIILMINKQIKKRVVHFTQALYQSFAIPYTFDGNAILLSVSMGSSFFPEDGDDRKTLLKKADLALYRAKMLGRHRYEFYKNEVKIIE